ncbi:uncharacterized protein LOC129135541 isoform X2 [Pan troglodytes]|uniref:uncharacterized protein LOC129135541 isoform X2 n=1 Tax=Pan troglodytes TaxID=9598 RepID=UPI00301365F4
MVCVHKKECEFCSCWNVILSGRRGIGKKRSQEWILLRRLTRHSQVEELPLRDQDDWNAPNRSSEGRNQEWTERRHRSWAEGSESWECGTGLLHTRFCSWPTMALGDQVEGKLPWMEDQRYRKKWRAKKVALPCPLWHLGDDGVEHPVALPGVALRVSR